MAEVQEYDVVVIGAGPGGESAAVTAALLGKRVAVVEKKLALGGAAVNTGTIPSKTLRETAVALSGLRSRDLYGVDLSLRRSATVSDFLCHERAVKTTQREQLRSQFERHGIAVVHGTGRFADPHTVCVARPDGTELLLRGQTIVVAIGSAPARPPGIPFEHIRVHDSDELMELWEIPTSLAVVGAGVIGSEYACMFAALGVKVTVIDGRDSLLPFLDPDLSAALTVAMQKLGITFLWHEGVTRCDAPEVGDIRLTLQSGAELATSHVLVCAGRVSTTAALDPDAAGLGLSTRGLIPVDEHYRSSVPHVYAVGDVIGFPALASTSYEQGRVAASHACGIDVKTGPASALPAGIYTIPEVSAVGLTEPMARDKGIDTLVGRAAYQEVPRGKIIGDKVGFLKLVFRRDDLKLLGVHVIGEMASEVVHIGVMALTTGGTADLFLETCFNYPTLGELYKLATHDALLKR